jgi:hypothetical protein
MKLFKQLTGQGKTSVYPPDEALRLARKGKALIIVASDFEERFVPKGYVKLKLNTPDHQNFIGLVPQQAFFYLDSHNLSNGGIDEGLEALTALYDAIESENDLNGASRINAGGVDLAVTVRRNYQTLLVNKLVEGQKEEKKGKAEYAEYDKDEVERLCLDDKYVTERMRGIAAIALGKTPEQIKEQGLEKVLGFDTLEHEAEITEKEFRQITEMRYVPRGDPHTKTMRCLGDSHYYLKEEYKSGENGWDYDLRTMTKTRTDLTPSKIADMVKLEEEIHSHQKKKRKGEINDSDRNATRMVINMKYGAGLDVSPVYKNEPTKSN